MVKAAQPEVDWRVKQLRELGFKKVHADDLARLPDIAHRAAELLAAGCCHQDAWLILRD